MIKCILVIILFIFVLPTWIPIFIGMFSITLGAAALKITFVVGVVITILYIRRQPKVTEILYERKLNRLKRKGLLPSDATRIVQDEDSKQ